MSILIKDMEMPKSCKSCDLLQDYDGDMYCPLNDYLNFGDIENVPDYVMIGCPLSAQPDVTGINVGDMVSRQAAIDALDEQIEQCNKALGSFDISPKDEYAIKVERASLEAYKEQLENMPSAQPETAKRIVGKSRDGMTLWYQCDMCNEPVDVQDSFCRGCGRRLVNE